jgi:hypothetical protein
MLSYVECRDSERMIFVTVPVSNVAGFYRALKQGYGLIDKRSETLEVIDTNKAELERVIHLEGSCIRHMMPLSQCSYCYEELTKTKGLKDYLKKLQKRLHGQEFRLLTTMTDCFDWTEASKPQWLSATMWEKTKEAAGKCGGKIYNTLRERFEEWTKAREEFEPSKIAQEEKVKIFSRPSNLHPTSKFNPFVEQLVYEGFRRVQRQIEIVEKRYGEIRHKRDGKLLSVTEIRGDERVVTENETHISPDSMDYGDELESLNRRRKEFQRDYATRIKRRTGMTIAKPTITHVANQELPTERLIGRSNYKPPVKKESE